MEEPGLSTFALVFMLVSMGSVIALMAYCYWRILRDPDSAPGSRTVDAGGGEPL